MADAPLRKAGDLLSAFLDGDLSAKARNVSGFFRSWKAVAGDRLAAHSAVVEIDKGIVIVEADHPSWIQLLQMREEEFLHEIRSRWPQLEIRGIAFRLARDPKKPERREPSPPERLVAPEDLESFRVLGRTREKIEGALRSKAAAPDAASNSPEPGPEAPPLGAQAGAGDARLNAILKRFRKAVANRDKEEGDPSVH